MGALHAKSLRIEAPIPGEEAIGIEVPNRAPAGISFREIIESDAWRNAKGELPLLFGKDAAGKELVADLASMPHMLVAGATGQGKSVCLNSLINGLLMTKTPEQLKLIMVDPKSVEFTSYAALPHLIVPIITENQKVVFSLKWAVAEMEKRLKLFARARVRNIYDFNHRPSFTQTDMFGNDTAVGSDMPKTVPYIVIIIDEVADLMSQCSKEVSPHIARLTAKARAAGIHLILATQRPDARIITGAIKANIPGRVAFKTATGIDSRTILDAGGAENLIGARGSATRRSSASSSSSKSTRPSSSTTASRRSSRRSRRPRRTSSPTPRRRPRAPRPPPPRRARRSRPTRRRTTSRRPSNASSTRAAPRPRTSSARWAGATTTRRRSSTC